MKRVAIVLTGLLLSTAALAGKPDPAVCPCNLDGYYSSSFNQCGLTYSVTKGRFSEYVLGWYEDSPYEENYRYAAALKSRGTYGCSTPETSPNDSGDPVELITRKQFIACVTELEAIFEDNTSATSPCNF